MKIDIEYSPTTKEMKFQKHIYSDKAWAVLPIQINTVKQD